MKAWHFVGDKLHDGQPVPPDGEWLEHTGELVMCESGLHASRRIIDALSYARNDTICRVECGGAIIEDTDKLVCSRRKILWRVDGEGLLRQFARECALSVAHLWDMPDIVRRYLETGDEAILAAAGAAAGAAARAAAWAAAAHPAARAAAWVAAMDAAWDAARATARERQNIRLENMVRNAHKLNDAITEAEEVLE